MNDDHLELAQALTDYKRTFLALGEAFIAAAGRLDADTLTRRDVTAALSRELTARDMLIDLLALDTAFIGLIGLEAGKSGVTVRELLERHFEAAPTDAEWRALLDGANRRRAEEPT